jgi:hypothetical protein
MNQLMNRMNDEKCLEKTRHFLFLKVAVFSGRGLTFTAPLYSPHSITGEKMQSLTRLAFLFIITLFLSTVWLLNSQSPVAATHTLTPADVQALVSGQYLKASNTEAGDSFGQAVALSGNLLAVGAPGEDSGATGVNGDQADNSADSSGAVYIFAHNGTTWVQEAYLKASNTQTNDAFGTTVALSGNVLVVGAPYENSNATGVNGNQDDNSASDAGAAYVFVRTNEGVWSQQAYLKASNTEAEDYFGYTVEVDGQTIIVGAVFEDSNATGINNNQADNSASNAGAAYVFVFDGLVWSQQAYLKASNTDAQDSFTVSLALDGDTLVVGADGEDSNGTGQGDNSLTNVGAAYVFVRQGTNWSQQAYLKASNPDELDLFGSFVTLDGDTLAVSAHNESSNATGINGNQADNSLMGSGAVYVFTRTGETWSQTTYIKASNPGMGDSFGWEVKLAGNYLLVGARFEASNATGVDGNQEDNSVPAAGAAYLFVRQENSWTQQHYLKASNPDIVDIFSWGLAINSNFVVGSSVGESSNTTGIDGNQTDNSAQNAGAAYTFSFPQTPTNYPLYLPFINHNTAP